MHVDKESFILGIVITLLMTTLTILFSQFYFNFFGLTADKNFSSIYTIYTLIIVLIISDFVIIFYFLFLKEKVVPEERVKELEIKLKSIKLGKEEAKKRYYRRSISKETFNKIMQDYEQEEIRVRSEIESLKSKLGNRG